MSIWTWRNWQATRTADTLLRAGDAERDAAEATANSIGTEGATRGAAEVQRPATLSGAGR